MAEKRKHPGIRVRETGTGARRYDVRYRSPDGSQLTKSFEKLAAAQRFQAMVKADMARGQYLDPNDGRVTFREYSEDWLTTRTTAITTQVRVESYLRIHVWPVIGHLPLTKVRASSIQTLASSLDHLAPTTQEQVLKTASAVFAAAVEDERILKNPCLAKSVSTARIEKKRIVPWTTTQVADFRAELPERYAILAVLGAGLGFRQGETYALSPDDIHVDGAWVTVQRQVRQLSGSRLHFASPKYGKVRDVPLPPTVRDALLAYQERFPPRAVTLPWNGPDGQPVTARLFVTSREARALNRNYINAQVWKPALTASGVPPVRENGSHALRHHYASVLLDAGESIKAVSEYLGHADAGFTLRTYTHLMPRSSERTRAAIDAAMSGD